MSKRHNKVTRIGTCTTYRVSWVRANGEQVSATYRTWEPGVTVESLTEKMTKDLRDLNLLLSSVEILKQDGPHLYGMARDDFFRSAEKLD